MLDSFPDLLRLTDVYLPRSHSPYSGRPESAVALLSDGTWVPGVRVESASFSLTIDAAANALTTAIAAGRTDIVAIALSHDAPETQSAYLANLGFCAIRHRTDRLFVAPQLNDLPERTAELDPIIPSPKSDADGIQAAREIAHRAFIPQSSFPVGCIAAIDDRTAVPGVNVENADWNRILCAERNALGTAASYGLGAVRRLFLSCPQDAAGSPCGACRQLLAELAPASTIVMDRHPAVPHMTTSDQLLPDSFTGNALLHRRNPETPPHSPS